MNGYTKADNWLWDYVMPKAKPNTFKVVAAVVRMTTGWHKEEAALTFDELQEMTGIAGRGTLSRAIDDAVSEGFIGRTESGRTFSYSTKVILLDSTKTEPSDPPAVSKQNQEQYQNDTGDGTKTEPSTSSPKETERKRNKETPPTPPDVDYTPTLPGAPPEMFEENPRPAGIKLPEVLDVPEFWKAWIDWEKHRDETGAPLSYTAKTHQLDRMAAIGPKKAVWLIKQSLISGYKGILWDKLDSDGNPRDTYGGKHNGNGIIPKPTPGYKGDEISEETMAKWQKENDAIWEKHNA